MIYFAIALGIMFFLAMPEFCIILCLLAGLVWLVMNFWGLFLVLLGIIFVILIFIGIGKSLVDVSLKEETKEAEEDYKFIFEAKKMTKNNNKEKTKSSFWNVFIILFFSYPLIYEFFGFYSDYKSFIKGGLFELVLGHIICFIPIMLIYIVLYISFKVTLEYYKKKKNFISYVKKLKEENIKYYDKPQKSQAISYNKPQKAKRISLEVFDKTKHKGLHYSAIKNIEQSVYGNIDPLKVKARKLNQQIKAKQAKKLAIAKGLKRTPIALGYLVFFLFSMSCVMLFSVLLFYIGVPSFISFFVFIFLMGYLIYSFEKSLEKHFNKPLEQQIVLGLKHIKPFSKINHKGLYYSAIKNIEQSVYGNIDPLKVKARKLSQQAKAQQEKAISKIQNKISLIHFLVSSATFIFFIAIACGLFFSLISIIGDSSLYGFELTLFLAMICFAIFIGYFINKKIHSHYFTSKRRL